LPRWSFKVVISPEAFSLKVSVLRNPTRFRRVLEGVVVLVAKDRTEGWTQKQLKGKLIEV
jgi:hypothetical protein